MAIYHFSTKIMSRSKGQSAVACAAYRAGDKLYDERQDKLQDYTKKKDVIYSEIILPDNAPAWMNNREKLWNHIEKIEFRKDSRLAREFEIALPRELTTEQNIALVKEFVNENFTAKGLVVDVAMHNGIASDGCKQPHAHLMAVERELVHDGFGKKYRELNKIENLYFLRKEFADHTNKHLALNGHDIQVDHRSLKDQGIDLIPQKKIGATGSFHQMASYAEQLLNDRHNGERLLANPEIVLDVLTNQQSTFTHHDIARIVNRYTADGDQFLAVCEKIKASHELVSLGEDEKHQERFTTKGMLQLESEMVGNACSLYSKNGHSLSDIAISPVAEQHQLSSEQTKVFNHLVADGDLKNVIGFAGTGKSRLLGASRELWEQSGYRVLGATLSGIAAQNLEASSGIESRTLASRFHYWNKGEELLTPKDILVIDEAGMIGSRQMAEVMDEANKCGAKVILMGDPEQLQAIQAGAAFRGIIERTSYVELTEIWRQNITWQKDATIQFATQKTKDALDQYAAHDCVHEFDTQSQAKEALVDAWNDARLSQPDKSQIILAYTREDVKELNTVARALRQSLGELGADHLINTERGERQFAEGEQIYFLKNDRDLGVKNGTLGTIIGIDNDSLIVQIGKGDSDKSHDIKFSTAKYNHLDYGYAATIHKGQGITVDRSFALASQYLDRHATYVALTRHRDGAEIFWSKDEFPSYDAMTNALGHERSKDTTLDHISWEFDKASFAAHRGLDTLWDNFWEKYGSEWLERIQHVLSAWIDNAKEYVEVLQEKIAKAIGTKEVPQHNDGIGDDAWLKEMRAWVDEEFGEKSTAITNEQLKQTADSISVEHSSISLNAPVTDEQRAHNEERYQKIMKEAAMGRGQEQGNQLTDTFDQSHSLHSTILQKNDIDKEIEF